MRLGQRAYKMICVVDMETTGTSLYSSEIIEAYFICVDDKLSVHSEFSLKCNPVKWNYEAFLVHCIPESVARTYPLFKDCFRQLIDWFIAYDIKEMWCHANPSMFGKITYFDYTLLRLQMSYVSDDAYWVVNGITPYSTHTLASLHLQVDKLDLKTICDKLGIPLHHHNAESDTKAALEIMRRLPIDRENINIKLRGYHDAHGTVEPDRIKPTPKRRSSKRV
jgi:DNA polymerase III epsilon subunit-like protein